VVEQVDGLERRGGLGVFGLAVEEQQYFLLPAAVRARELAEERVGLQVAV